MLAHLAAHNTIGQTAETREEILSTVCATCGGIIDPLLGKVHEGTTVRWDVWIKGNYEHRNRPTGGPHPAIPWPMANPDAE